MISLCKLFPLFLFLLTAGEAPADSADQRVFTLTIQEKRSEQVVTPGESSTVPAEFETNSMLHGRIIVPDQTLAPLAACTDSIRIATSMPFPFESFLSRDTLYYRAEGKPTVINKQIDAVIDSMLRCVFEGPALLISMREKSESSFSDRRTGEAPRARTVTDQKPECGSGEYSRLNLPVSLGFFFPHLPRPVNDYRWRQRKTLPSFSGLHFFPEIEISLRIVKVEGAELTVVFTADTTFEDLRLTMPSGEEIDLLEDAIHIGGTFFIDSHSGVTVKGELRIDEEITYLRPRVSTMPASKDCSYLLRLKTR
jgi:hypothetical protein